MDMNIAIVELEPMDIAYVTRKGLLLEAREAWNRLIAWTAPRGLFPPERLFIGISEDDPREVRAEDCRFNACVTLPDGFPKEPGPVNYDHLPGGLHATFDFHDRPDRLGFAYSIVREQWLPESDYVQDEKRPCLEICLNDPAADPEGKARVRLCVPIVSR